MRIILFLLITVLITSCGNDEPKKDNVIFFQSKQFFQQQLDDIKKTPYFIYKIETIDSVRDSMALSVDQLEKYVKAFTEADINDPSIKKNYEESVFLDETTKTYSLSYTTSNKDLPVQNMNVLLREDGETVKNIFIRKYMTSGDSSIIEQLSWKPGESFESNRLIQSANKERMHKVQVVWNDN